MAVCAVDTLGERIGVEGLLVRGEKDSRWSKGLKKRRERTHPPNGRNNIPEKDAANEILSENKS